MKKNFVSLAAVALLAMASFAAPTFADHNPDARRGGCVTHTIFGAELEKPLLCGIQYSIYESSKFDCAVADTVTTTTGALTCAPKPAKK